MQADTACSVRLWKFDSGGFNERAARYGMRLVVLRHALVQCCLYAPVDIRQLWFLWILDGYNDMSL
jgi:hypothetical protein